MTRVRERGQYRLTTTDGEFIADTQQKAEDLASEAARQRMQRERRAEQRLQLIRLGVLS
jgi:hypothetical protein